MTGESKVRCPHKLHGKPCVCPLEHHQCRVVESCSGVWQCPKCKRLVGLCHGGSEPPDWCDDCWAEGRGDE
jgi:hypothetical protein